MILLAVKMRVGLRLTNCYEGLSVQFCEVFSLHPNFLLLDKETDFLHVTLATVDGFILDKKVEAEYE